MRRTVLGAGIAVVSVVAATAVLIAASAVARTHTQPVSYSVTGAPDDAGGPVYLSLGDSLAAGAGPAGAAARGTRLVELGCPGETISTMVRGGICDYPSSTVTSGTSLAGSQLAAATSYLTAHPGQVSLITLSIGANDLSSCLAGSDGAATAACVQQAIPAAEQNLTGILAGLRFAGYRSAIVATTDQEPGPSQPQAATYDRALRAVYQAFDVRVTAASITPGESAPGDRRERADVTWSMAPLTMP
jgi:lysophospholipase L1-like esterase